METTTRKPRYTRGPVCHTIEPHELTERQLNVLLMLNEHGPLTSPFLQEFDRRVGYKHENSFSDCLRQLYEKYGLVDRLTYLPDSFRTYSSPMAHTLSDRAETLLAKMGYTVYTDTFKVAYTPHNLLAAQYVANVRLSCDDEIKFISQHDIFHSAPETTREKSKPFEIPVFLSYPGYAAVDTAYVADGWFGLEYKGERVFYCLEVNHSDNVENFKSLKPASHRRKFLSIRELRRGGFRKELNIERVSSIFLQTYDAVTARSMKLLDTMTKGKGAPFFLFDTHPIVPTLKPDKHMLDKPFKRVGMADTTLREEVMKLGSNNQSGEGVARAT